MVKQLWGGQPVVSHTKGGNLRVGNPNPRGRGKYWASQTPDTESEWAVTLDEKLLWHWSRVITCCIRTLQWRRFALAFEVLSFFQWLEYLTCSTMSELYPPFRVLTRLSQLSPTSHLAPTVAPRTLRCALLRSSFGLSVARIPDLFNDE